MSGADKNFSNQQKYIIKFIEQLGCFSKPGYSNLEDILFFAPTTTLARKILNIREIDEKPQITYPCRWPFKVIGLQKEELVKAVSNIVADSDHTLTHSKKSRSGKYHSLNLEIFVESEESRNFFFNELRTHAAVIMVF